MTGKRNRDKVIAEITVSHLMGLAIKTAALCFRAGDVEAHDAGWLGFYRMQLIAAVH